MKAVVAAFNQEKALLGAFSVITNLRMDLFEAPEDREEGPRYSQKPCWAATPRGWERVQFSAQWSRGLNLPDTVLEDFRTGRRHLIRKM